MSAVSTPETLIFYILEGAAAIFPISICSATCRQICFLFLYESNNLSCLSSVNLFLLRESLSWCFDIAMINKNILQYKNKSFEFCILHFLTFEFKGGFYFELLSWNHAGWEIHKCLNCWTPLCEKRQKRVSLNVRISWKDFFWTVRHSKNLFTIVYLFKTRLFVFKEMLAI